VRSSQAGHAVDVTTAGATRTLQVPVARLGIPIESVEVEAQATFTGVDVRLVDSFPSAR